MTNRQSAVAAGSELNDQRTHKNKNATQQPLRLEEIGNDRSFPLAREIWQFVRATGKWWLAPVLIALLVLATAILLSASSFAPFFYTLF